MSNKAELLKKVKALADRGTDGEKESAQDILTRLMEKYDIVEQEIEEERRSMVFFAYSQKIESKLLNQIIYMVTGSVGYGCVGASSRRSRKKLGADVTAAERLEIEANYEFFKAAMQAELDIFFSAFVNKNDLFPSLEKIKEEESAPKAPADRERALKINAMMNGMDRHTLLKMLESTKSEQ